MEVFEAKGIWRGEYVYDDKFQPSFIKSSIPFLLKIKSIDDAGFFEGMCQDDPTISHLDFPAEVYGNLNGNELIFTKRYPKAAFQDEFGRLVTDAQVKVDVIYQAKISNSEKILGTWRLERTYAKLRGKVRQIGPISGVWWMSRF
jgi:hypothetical protein